SIMFAIARAMQLGRWDESVYDIKAKEKEELRSAMKKIKTEQDAEWERRYHSTDPKEQAFGGTMIVTLVNGKTVKDSKACANAHPLGKTPWERPDYIRKLERLTEGLLSDIARERFLKTVEELENAKSSDLSGLTPRLDRVALAAVKTCGIYGVGGGVAAEKSRKRK
ncbi:MAG: MmgE/PrpD family protein, partial [Alphaproteobacteria bacterium]|nr:MmgE/PrpD family protein [Alphaproteobacteria bacterium]